MALEVDTTPEAQPKNAAVAASAPQATAKELHLPTLVFGGVEVRRLQLELDELDAYMQQAAIRQTKTKASAPLLPRVSRLLDALAAENQRNLLKQEDRTQLQAFLAVLLQHAPTIHMSFASDPSSAFTAKIVAWLRANVHPFALLQIGLQPSIAAGCIVRTNNKVFDLSLRQHFADQKQMLIASMREKSAA